MRAAALVVLAVLPLAGLLPAAPAQEPISQTEALLARARTALGGDARLSAVRTLVMSGAISVGSGATKDYGSFKVHIRLPDAFLRYRSVTTLRAGNGASVDTSRTVAFGTGSVGPSSYWHATTLGFAGRRLLYEPHVYQPHMVRQLGPASQDEIERLFREGQREFIRTTVVLFAASFAGAPVQFRDAAGDPQSVMVISGGGERKLTFDAQSHLPVQFDNYVYSEHRDVNGLKVPFRIVQGLGRRPWETWDVREFKIDEPIPPSVFRH